MWALENGNLHLIDTSNLTISATKIANVERITNNKDIVLYLTTDKTENKRMIRLYKDGESRSSDITEVKSATAIVTLAMGTYWGDDWFAYNIDNKVTILTGTPPSADKPRNNALKTLLSRDLEYTPQHISVNDNQRLVVFATDHNLMSYDVETRNYYDSSFESTLTSINWLDDFLLWQRHEDKIIIQDFDGGNRRELLKKVNTQLPIALSENNKWLYFFELTEEVDEKNIDSTATTDEGAVETNTETKLVYTLKREKTPNLKIVPIIKIPPNLKGIFFNLVPSTSARKLQAGADHSLASRMSSYHLRLAHRWLHLRTTGSPAHHKSRNAGAKCQVDNKSKV